MGVSAEVAAIEDCVGPHCARHLTPFVRGSRSLAEIGAGLEASCRTWLVGEPSTSSGADLQDRPCERVGSKRERTLAEGAGCAKTDRSRISATQNEDWTYLIRYVFLN